MKVNSKIIYGAADADIRQAGFTLSPDAIVMHCHELEMRYDPLFPHHRKHLSGKETLAIYHLAHWNYGLKTYNKPFPSLHYLATLCGMSYKHACVVVRYLERQGLLLVRRAIHLNVSGSKRTPSGRPHRFDLTPLKDKIRKLLGLVLKKEREPLPEPEHREESAAAPAEEVAECSDGPPLKAPAEEWYTIKTEAVEQVRKVSKHATYWFSNVEGWRHGRDFVILCPRSATSALMIRWNYILEPLIRKYCRWALNVRYDVRKPA